MVPTFVKQGDLGAKAKRMDGFRPAVTTLGVLSQDGFHALLAS